MEFLTVAYGEFQALYLEGDIYIHPDRIHQIGTDSAGGVDIHDRRFAMLLLSLPQLSFQEEEGILLLQLNGESNVGSHPVRLLMSRVKSISALSEPAHKLLAQRLESFGIGVRSLSSDGQFQRLLDSRKSELSIRAGEELVRLLFKKPDDAMFRVLSQLLRETPDCGIGQSKIEGTSWSGWLAEASRYTRNDPYEKGVVDYITDAWKSLVKAAENHGRPFKYERVSTHFSDDTRSLLKQRPSLEKLLSNPDFCNAIGKFELEFKKEAQIEHAFAALTVFFFLRRICFEKQRRELNFDLLLEEAGKLANSAYFSAVQTSVWLLGSHLGFERIAKYVYAADAERFSWFVGERLQFSKISRPAVSEIATSDESMTPVEPWTSSAQPSPEERTFNLPEKEGKAEIISADSSQSTENLSTTCDTGTKSFPGEVMEETPKQSPKVEATDDAKNLKDEIDDSAAHEAPKQTDGSDSETAQETDAEDNTETTTESSADKQKKPNIKNGSASPTKKKTVDKKSASKKKSKPDKSDEMQGDWLKP
ncbi:hypothetical protein ACFL3I_08250 [Pseudomonadota bacterium]